MNLTRDEKKAAVITTLSNSAKFLGISTIFQFQPTPNKNQSFTHSAELELYIDEALKKSLLAGYLNHDVIITIYRISMCIFFIKLLDLSIIKME